MDAGTSRSTSASQPLARRETPAMCRPPRLPCRLPEIGARRKDLDDPSVSVIQTPHMEGSERRIRSEVERRRTFAIISHPDAGKTTLTEKLLLFGGALREAGAVRARRAARHATSDWLELEKQRGISVSTSVMHFEHAGYRVNILDTPGHQDFSEDTYR